MTDADLIAKKLAFIESCVADLRRLGQPERIGDDLREQRFAAYTLQIAIRAALDVAAHIVADVAVQPPLPRGVEGRGERAPTRRSGVPSPSTALPKGEGG